MTEDINTKECADPTQNFIAVPCRMVKRIERYAKEKGLSVDNVMIEAFDSCWRSADTPHQPVNLASCSIFS